LKAWNAPALVTSVEIDASTGKVVQAENARVEEVSGKDTVSWNQQDMCLPMPINKKNPIIALAVKASDVEPALNQETLKVSGLGAARYVLKIDGKDVAELSKDNLAVGINLADIDTPMLRQALAVHDATLRHNDLHFLRWRTVQVPNDNRGYPGLAKALEGLDALEADLVAEQRAKAKPVPHRFELVPKS
jgi:hypothetical protein